LHEEIGKYEQEDKRVTSVLQERGKVGQGEEGGRRKLKMLDRGKGRTKKSLEKIVRGGETAERKLTRKAGAVSGKEKFL